MTARAAVKAATRIQNSMSPKYVKRAFIPTAKAGMTKI
jgi:hypothetical protein